MTWYAGTNSTNNSTFGWLFEASPNVTVGVTGVSATGAVGTAEAITAVDIVVNVTGVSATGAVGSVSVSGGAVVSVTGVSATGAVGSVSVSGGAVVSVTGVPRQARLERPLP
jgi:hypothetical protein